MAVVKSFFASLFHPRRASKAARRVLVLHGYGQNAHILSKRMQALRQECGKDCEFVFLDAPHVMRGANAKHHWDPLAVATAFPDTSDPENVLRAWFTADENLTYRGSERTIAYLRDFLAREKPFNAIMGFSQGAIVASMIAALLERPEIAPDYDFLVNGRMPHPPFEFAVLCSGGRPRDPKLLRIFDATSRVPAGLNTRSLHIIGNADIVVVPEFSQLLYNSSRNARVVYHAGGHFIPSTPLWRKFMCGYLTAKNDKEAKAVPTPSTAGHIHIHTLVTAHTLSPQSCWKFTWQAGG